EWVWKFWRALVTRNVEVQTVDRGVALGAQAFTAVVPLLMLFALVAPRREGRDFADTLIARFELSGSSAEALRQAFSPPELTTQSVSVFGVVLLIIATLSFTRTLQRLYENAYGLPKLGFRGTPWGLIWIGFLAVATSVNPLVRSFFDGTLGVVVAIGVAAISWGITPYILTAKRIVPGQAVTAGIIGGIAMTGLGVASTIWFPHSVATSAAQYGLIGVAFASVGWLVSAGLTLAFSAVGAAVVADFLGYGPAEKEPT
ncbi:MAG: hypothetical protein JHD16_18470, partial [Solirubrobacteraceae bacterium]|nr:hypothetical protein [Solirubrobacteraceae bacterium]